MNLDRFGERVPPWARAGLFGIGLLAAWRPEWLTHAACRRSFHLCHVVGNERGFYLHCLICDSSIETRSE